jgi:hypothetical protein
MLGVQKVSDSHALLLMLGALNAGLRRPHAAAVQDDA